MISPKVITAPSIEPVSLDEVKEQLRLESTFTDNDTMLSTYISAARQYVEDRTGRTIYQATYEFVMDDWPESEVVLPRATPLISIDSVKYKDSDGTETTLDSSVYCADTDNLPGRMVLGYDQSWPSFTPYSVNPIRIRYTAGLANSPLVEAAANVKYPILLLVAAMYENPSAVVVGDRNVVSQISIQYGVEHYLASLQVEYGC